MKIKAIIFFSFILFFAPVLGYGQTDPMVKSIQDRFDLYGKTALQEKIYLHTDRSFYLVGETMWFKAYYLNGSTHRFLDMSKVAYMEVLDKENNAIIQTKFSLLAGKGNGSLLIPATIGSGTYKVRCYTNWMKNFSSDYFFETTITVVNPFVKFDPNPDDKQEVTYDIQFFPEGGQLVKNVESKVGFRAVASNGKGIDFNGVVVDQKNDTIVKFFPKKFGIGNFAFKPVEGNAYKVLIRDTKGKISTYKLPEVKDYGYVMQVKDSTANLVKVLLTVQTEKPENNITVFTHTHQENGYAETKPLFGKKAVFLLDKNKLGEGISQITIFNDAGKPVCERLYFKRPAKGLIIDGKVSKQEYATRDKVIMDLSTASDAGIAEMSNLSVSVYMTDSIPMDDHESISSYLYLSSDLKGNIESPEYYAQRNSKEADQDIDNLMITHGWRRFKWDDIFANTTPSFPNLPEFDGHFITGKLMNTVTGEPANGIGTYLAAPDFQPGYTIRKVICRGWFVLK